MGAFRRLAAAAGTLASAVALAAAPVGTGPAVATTFPYDA
jgi:hypothetical protein